MAEQGADLRYDDEAQKALGGLVVAGCDATGVRPFVEAALDKATQPVPKTTPSRGMCNQFLRDGDPTCTCVGPLTASWRVESEQAWIAIRMTAIAGLLQNSYRIRLGRLSAHTVDAHYITNLMRKKLVAAK
jgi:hypothetical protein